MKSYIHSLRACQKELKHAFLMMDGQPNINFFVSQFFDLILAIKINKKFLIEVHIFLFNNKFINKKNNNIFKIIKLRFLKKNLLLLYLFFCNNLFFFCNNHSLIILVNTHFFWYDNNILTTYTIYLSIYLSIKKKNKKG